MTQFLPPNLLALFAPRDPIQYITPVSKLPHEKKNRGYIGVGEFLKYFEKSEDTPPPKKIETREERLERRRRERAEQVAYKLEQEIAVWDPASLQNATVDPFRTLFIARINYDSSESKLRREFEVYGAIRKIVLVHDGITGKPRGYAFIEYEHERDMHSAYKHADGKKIDGRRVLVDVERGRTVKGWLPRRLGGGLGGTRRGGPDVNLKHSGREDNERDRYTGTREESTEVRERRRPNTPERDRERVERRRSRSPRIDRDKDIRRRRSRTRSRERRRRDMRDDIEPVEDRHDKDRDKKRRRSRSYERERKRERRDRDRDRNRDKDRKDNIFGKEEKVRVKSEPADDYPVYNSQQPPPPLPGQMPYQDQQDYSSAYPNFNNYSVKKEEDRRYSFSNQDENSSNGNFEMHSLQQPPPAPSYSRS